MKGATVSFGGSLLLGGVGVGVGVVVVTVVVVVVVVVVVIGVVVVVVVAAELFAIGVDSFRLGIGVVAS